MEPHVYTSSLPATAVALLLLRSGFLDALCSAARPGSKPDSSHPAGCGHSRLLTQFRHRRRSFS